MDVVVKIGGSACTIKASFETLNEAALTATAQQLGALVKEQRRLAVIHGAGSFGHQQAKEYGVSKGEPQRPLSARMGEGFAKTRLSVTTLNRYVVSALVEQGVAAVGISPCPFVATKAKKLSGGLPADTTEGILGLLSRGLVPVVHGDAVLDEDQMVAILSGDTWMVELCREFQAKTAVFITDVDGVLTKPPGESGAELIPEILVNPQTGELELGGAAIGESAFDVTGGLKAKLQSATDTLLLAPSVEAVCIVRAGSEAAAQALRGLAPIGGTVLRRRK